MHLERIFDERLLLHRGRTVVGNPELDRGVLERTDHEVRNGVARPRPLEVRVPVEGEIELEDRPDELVSPLQRVVAHVERHRVFQLIAVVVLRVDARIRKVDPSRYRVAHASPVVADVDVHTLIARSDVRDRAAARSSTSGTECDFVDKPRTEHVHIAHAKLIHVAEDRLLARSSGFPATRAVASVGEEVCVQLIAAREMIVPAAHVDRVVSRRGRQGHDGAAVGRRHVSVQQSFRNGADTAGSDDVVRHTRRARAVGKRARS